MSEEDQQKQSAPNEQMSPASDGESTICDESLNFT